MPMNMTEFARAYGTHGPKILIAELVNRMGTTESNKALQDAALHMADELREAITEFIQ